MTTRMYHFTHDGEYVDGVSVTPRESNDDTFLRKLANTYEGCHAWVLVKAGTPTWMQMVAVAMPYERWQPEATASVPECVRTAEFVRDKS